MKRSLTDPAIRKLKPKDKPFKKGDGGGLYLFVTPAGSLIWRFDFKIDGKAATLTIGQYPAVTLAQARETHEEARTLVLQGIDPRQAKTNKEKRFSDYAREMLETQDLAPATLNKKLLRMEKYLFPVLDRKPPETITAVDLLNLIKPIAQSGTRETAIRLAAYCRQVFDTMLALQLIENNPAESVARLLPKPPQHVAHAHLTDQSQLGEVLRGIDAYKGDCSVAQALKFAPLVFLRPHNVRFLKWDHVNLDERIILIPAAEMKMNRPHKVPLSDQAVAILKDMRRISGSGELVFQGRRGALSENTLNGALKRITGGRGILTSHGLRHTASTLLNEQGFGSDAIELQMAHVNKDRIRATYNKAELMPERIRMMQSWADFLDDLKQPQNVIHGRFGKSA
ncbi:MAG: integrase arm-type DNA-binding domain-containing protein [Halothiobacillus sp.]|jgi:integrase|nr:integrase arm-type DNA-binding domain-containing protein [Halothiobacillus sp.]